jgi:hypothetical protein
MQSARELLDRMRIVFASLLLWFLAQPLLAAPSRLSELDRIPAFDTGLTAGWGGAFAPLFV